MWLNCIAENYFLREKFEKKMKNKYVYFKYTTITKKKAVERNVDKNRKSKTQHLEKVSVDFQ